MSAAAELTLHITRLVHERPDPWRSPASWSIVWDDRRLTWDDACAAPDAARKPVLVAPLLEPGWIALWHRDDLDERRRARFDAQIENQLQYYRAKLDAIGLGDGDTVRFEAAPPGWAMTVADFLGWASEYGMLVGISLAAADAPGACRVIIRPAGGGGPPLGMQASPYDRAP